MTPKLLRTYWYFIELTTHTLLSGKALDLPHPAPLRAAHLLSADTLRRESVTRAERERWRAEAT